MGNRHMKQISIYNASTYLNAIYRFSYMESFSALGTSGVTHPLCLLRLFIFALTEITLFLSDWNLGFIGSSMQCQRNED